MPENNARAPVGLIATRLADVLVRGDILFIAADEQRAEAVAAALQSAAPTSQVVHSPSSDALPGDAFGASLANVGRRVAALRLVRIAVATKSRPPLAFITTAEAAATAYPPPDEFDRAPPALAIGDTLAAEAFALTLAEIGYFADDRVDEPGEMAIRGQVIDLYPADAPRPVRVEFEAERITAIRGYDPVSQLTQDDLQRIEIGRVSEPPVGADWTTLFDHLPGAAIAMDHDVTARRDRYVALVRESVRQPPVVDAPRWESALKGREQIDLAVGGETDVPRFVEGKAPLRAVTRFAKSALADSETIILLGAERDLRFLGSRLARAVGQPCQSLAGWSDVSSLPKASLAMLAMPVERGWRLPGLVVLAAADLLGSRALGDRERATTTDPLRGELGEIRIGDVVVHEDFGVGVVAGLDEVPAIEASGEPGDAISLEFAGGARRLVPVEDADRLWRYGADSEAVTLDKLDASSWETRRIAIDAAIAESARAMTALAAERDRRVTEPLAPDVGAYERFSAGFAFTETPDQARAIDAVRADLASGKPMDRLVVGDVGYGKTEVALRAAAIAALAGRQVALAAPTTVLVRQHLEVFAKRFEGTGLNVAGLSRLSTTAERKAVKAGLADGSIAIVIGTGAVAAKGVAYRDLGLVIVDEEQRFGAADKAKLRALNADGHVLTLTATPIPRTLQAALVGLQQVSVIATPPARRQPIRTSVNIFDTALVRTALLRERGRGGQSFIVVPRIEDMAPMADRLAKLLPDLVVRTAHGKLPPAEVDEAMVAFARGDGDVLLATNIIEAGLDVPRANTMIVWRADRFGLSQLHQLRGRVGRGGRRGQILLLTDPNAKIADATLRRLRTLEALDRLGAGFAISARDLDMRGAGDLLGDAQAGHMKLIGVDLYQHLLEGALRVARGEAAERWTPQLKIGIAGRLPEDWIPEADVRVALYGRLARLTETHQLDAFEAELEDRFGALPPAAEDLMTLARLRTMAHAACVAKVDAGPSAIALTPRADFAAAEAARFLEEKDGRWLLREALSEPRTRAERLATILETLSPD